MSIEIEGNVFKVLSEVSGEGRNGRWVKQDFVIETFSDYPKKICFSTWGDKTDLVKTLSTGEKIKVSFNPESREYNEKWYTDLRAWKIERDTKAKSSGNSEMPPISEYNAPPEGEENDDIPF